MFGKNLVFYAVSSTIIAVAAQALGAGIEVVLLFSLLGPPALLLVIAVVRYNSRP
ncbi:MAG: hypothetical protein HY532_04365 [Chloroflexi bacterium]|nr:hypothetical protein [Chloroflexota bacterium]